MTPRRLGLLLGLAAMAVLGPRWVRAQGTKESQPITMYRAEGRDVVYFNVSCATATWTVVLSSDSIARSTFIQAISSNTQAVCLSSATSSQNCDSSAAGPELPPTSALTDYGHAGWACKAVTGTSAQRLKGYRARDRGDYGAIGLPGR